MLLKAFNEKDLKFLLSFQKFNISGTLKSCKDQRVAQVGNTDKF